MYGIWKLNMPKLDGKRGQNRPKPRWFGRGAIHRTSRPNEGSMEHSPGGLSYGWGPEHRYNRNLPCTVLYIYCSMYNTCEFMRWRPMLMAAWVVIFRGGGFRFCSLASPSEGEDVVQSSMMEHLSYTHPGIHSNPWPLRRSGPGWGSVGWFCFKHAKQRRTGVGNHTHTHTQRTGPKKKTLHMPREKKKCGKVLGTT